MIKYYTNVFGFKVFYLFFFPIKKVKGIGPVLTNQKDFFILFKRFNNSPEKLFLIKYELDIIHFLILETDYI